MRGKVDLAFLMRRIMRSRLCRTRVQLALPGNAFSAARSARPFAQSLKADSGAKRKSRLTTDPRMASAGIAGDRVDARTGLRSGDRGVGT